MHAFIHFKIIVSKMADSFVGCLMQNILYIVYVPTCIQMEWVIAMLPCALIQIYIIIWRCI